MRRREFIAGLGGTVAESMAARAQQPALAVVGFIGAGLPDIAGGTVAGLRRGLQETGYVEGRNLAVEYRWAEYRLETMPDLANDLVRRKVAVIVVLSTPAASAAKAATKTIPIVFGIGSDPVEAGFVASLGSPGGNLTGVFNLLGTVAAKRLQLIHELLPAAASIGFLVNPTNVIFAAAESRELQLAARTLGLNLVILNAEDESQFKKAFEKLAVQRAEGLVVGGDTLFINEAPRLIALAAEHGLPAIFPDHRATAAGGLMSYGTDFPDVYRQVGVYAGRILKGEKPADLPVQQVVKVDLVVNVRTAKALGLTVPETLLATADEVIQ
jgi:putative tryptophan/tyrosine transport system substrate-binding protein